MVPTLLRVMENQKPRTIAIAAILAVVVFGIVAIVVSRFRVDPETQKTNEAADDVERSLCDINPRREGCPSSPQP